jgi:hypothetical protein
MNCDIKYWFEFCTAAGINTRNLSPEEVYLTGGKIIKDKQIVDIERRFNFNAMDAIKTLTADERLALRERVTGVQLPARA